MKRSSNGFAAVGLIVVIIVLVAVGVAGYLVVNTQSKNDTVTVSTESQPASETQTKSGMKTTTLSHGTTFVSVEHPNSWEVKDTTEKEETYTLPSVYIKSEQGNYLHLFTSPGVGGDCPDNNDSFTLTKKIATSSPTIYFTEYTTTNPDHPIRKLTIEDFDNRNSRNSTVNEGDSDTNSCDMPSYSTVGGGRAENDIFVTINKEAKRKSLGSSVSFSDVSSNAAFIKMLGSVRVTN